MTYLDIELQALVRLERDRVLLARTTEDRSELAAKDPRDRRFTRLSLQTRRDESAPVPSPNIAKHAKVLTVLVVAVRPFDPTSNHSSDPSLFSCTSSTTGASSASSTFFTLSTRSIVARTSSCRVSKKKPRNSSASSWCPRRMASKRLLGLSEL